MDNFSRLHQLFVDYLHQNPFQSAPQRLYEPVNYILGLGGKRIRPVLLLMACQVFDDEVEKALPAAFSIELFHNFSLLHDDIMDEAPLRRGQQTVHQKYGVNSGILSGDVMLIYVYEYLLKVQPAPLLPTILAIFNKTAVEVCEGQQYDMDFENREDVTIEEYLKMIEQKTAVLLAASLKIGALIGGAGDQDADHLYEFGRNIGLAFQMQDDILDTYGDPEKFGKKVGGDIAQNKKTYLFLKAFELAKGEEKEKLKTLYYSDDLPEQQKIKEVTSLFNSLNVRALSEKVKEAYLEKAFDHLARVNVKQARKLGLQNLANQLMGREH